jgi:hypothetical protein
MTFEKFNKIMKRDYPYLMYEDGSGMKGDAYLEQCCIREIANIPLMRSLDVFCRNYHEIPTEIEFKSMVRMLALRYLREHEEEIMFREI